MIEFEIRGKRVLANENVYEYIKEIEATTELNERLVDLADKTIDTLFKGYNGRFGVIDYNDEKAAYYEWKKQAS